MKGRLFGVVSRVFEQFQEDIILFGAIGDTFFGKKAPKAAPKKKKKKEKKRGYSAPSGGSQRAKIFFE